MSALETSADATVLAPAVAELLGEVSHRLRTPLATATGYATLLADNPHLEPGHRVAWASAVVGACEQLEELLRDLARISRATDGAVHPTNVDLRALVSETLARLAQESDREIRLVNGPQVWLQVDRVALARALYQAAYYARSRASDVEMQISGPGPGAEVVVRIEASGELLPAPPPTNPWLHMCDSVARAHGGELRFTPTAVEIVLRSIHPSS